MLYEHAEQKCGFYLSLQTDTDLQHAGTLVVSLDCSDECSKRRQQPVCMLSICPHFVFDLDIKYCTWAFETSREKLREI